MIALPPSEGKTLPEPAARVDLVDLALPQLSTARTQIAAALAELGTSDAAAETLSVGPKARVDLQWNVASPPLGGPAYEVYTGVLFAAASLADRAQAPDRSVWIFSGRYGAALATDSIAPYRLPAGAVLPGVGNVTTYWRPHLRDALDPIACADGLILDCRSDPYQRMWPVPKDAVGISVRAVRERDGRRTVVSHMAKHYRGELTRHVLTAPQAPTNPEQVASLAEATGLKVELAELTDTHVELTLVIRD